ncbi:MAG: hypothetical protein K6E29_08155 [Cyanobacteria bacterium RUI128]|nr:hypothetical protein [Cyanobacteria bacterium RUI128]
MTLIQEANILMQQQPERNLQIIVDTLHAMSTNNTITVDTLPFKRTGHAKGLINLPPDFDDHFNDMDDEIADMFYGDNL